MRTYSVVFTRLIDGLPHETEPKEFEAQNIMACMIQMAASFLTFGGFMDIISIDIQEVDR